LRFAIRDAEQFDLKNNCEFEDDVETEKEKPLVKP
jgi:hypothetical protein